uniref:Uncharacterized protein n=1 Tax=Vitis vinifera TaxID=29760 RepID=F6I3J3_VITVI
MGSSGLHFELIYALLVWVMRGAFKACMGSFCATWELFKSIDQGKLAQPIQLVIVDGGQWQ